MSDWLNHLAALESEATEAPFRNCDGDDCGDPYCEGIYHDGCGVLALEDEKQNRINAELFVALRNNASELISRARRAEELEREREMLEAVRHSAEKVMGAYLHAGHVDVDDMDSLYIALRDAR